VKFEELANRYNFSGGQIKSAIIRAATKAALRSRKEGAQSLKLNQQDLERACKEESEKTGTTGSVSSMYT